MRTPSGPSLIPGDVLATRPPLARELTTRRIAAGLTQQALADTIGMHIYTVQVYEHGYQVPPPGTLERLKVALGWDGEVPS